MYSLRQSYARKFETTRLHCAQSTIVLNHLGVYSQTTEIEIGNSRKYAVAKVVHANKEH